MPIGRRGRGRATARAEDSGAARLLSRRGAPGLGPGESGGREKTGTIRDIDKREGLNLESVVPPDARRRRRT